MCFVFSLFIFVDMFFFCFLLSFISWVMFVLFFEEGYRFTVVRVGRIVFGNKSYNFLGFFCFLKVVEFIV